METQIKTYCENIIHKYIIEKLSKKTAQCIDYNDFDLKYLIGSNKLQNDIVNCKVWGAGVQNTWDDVDLKNNEIYSIRGYQSLKKIPNCENVGDPCFVLPFIFNPKIESPIYKVGIYCNDYDSKEHFNIEFKEDAEEMITDICNCERIFSSDLTILAIAQAYGISNKWVSNGGYFNYVEFLDFYSVTTIEVEKIKPIDIFEINDFEAFHIKPIKTIIDTISLYNSCPFRHDASQALLSVLICTIRERKVFFDRLYSKLKNQINKFCLNGIVDIEYICDNRELKIGAKRNMLVQKAKGKYVCFIDDDDDISDDYLKLLVEACKNDKDCVSLTGQITTNGTNPKRFIHSVMYKEYKEVNNIYFRPPNHLNCIRHSIAKKFTFEAKNFGEDTDWAMEICKSGIIKTETYIDKIIYFYNFVTK